MIKRTLPLTVLAAMAFVLLAFGSPVAANAAGTGADVGMQARVDAVLAEYPGGVQIGPNEVSWESGGVILTLASENGQVGSRAVGSCGSGSFCAYTGYSLSGSKLSFTTCTTHSTTVLGAVRSVANARSSGSIKAKNSSGTVLSTINAGSSVAYAPSNITQLTCGS